MESHLRIMAPPLQPVMAYSGVKWPVLFSYLAVQEAPQSIPTPDRSSSCHVSRGPCMNCGRACADAEQAQDAKS